MPTTPPAPATRAGAGVDLVAAQRRVLATLMVSQVLGSAGLTSAITVGTLIAKDLLGGDTFAGIAGAMLTVGSALGSSRIAVLMQRRGRRPGLVIGYCAAVVGGVVAIAGVQARWLPVFVTGQLLLGMGQASNLQARYAAADLAPPERKARAISLLVFSSTFGAVSGPALVGVGERLGRAAGIDELAGPFLLSIAFFLVAALNTTLRLRPDPLVLAGGTDPHAERRRVDVSGSLRIIGAVPAARTALATMVVSQAVMVGVMTMTPLHMKGHGHSVSLIGLVIACHIAGMYAPAPLVGWMSDRSGRLRAIVLGAVILTSSTVVTALAGYTPSILFVGLFLLGLGWSFGLVSGSALLSESIPAEHRVRVQGAADLCMSLCGGAAGFGSGFVKRAVGFHMLSNLGTVAAGLLVVAVASRLWQARAVATASA